jgi:hypothetical protein
MSTRPQSERPLSLKERTFVDRYLALGGERGAGTKAAQLAGYPASWAAIASHRMLRRPRVVRAIEAESKRLVRALGPHAIKVIKEILDNENHKDRLKAARTVLERIDPLLVGVAHQHDVKVTVKSGDNGLELLRRLRELGAPREMMERVLGVNGLPLLEERLDGNGKAPEPEPVTIEGEVLAAEPDDDG